jgi:uncharacterized membrane protein
MRLATVPLLFVLSAGCDPAPATKALDSAVTDTGTDAACLEPDLPTWEAWGEGFFVTWCQSCHSRTTPQRAGAPDGIDFDNAGDIRSQANAIRRTVLDAESMPVGGGLNEADREALDLLLRCGA